MSLDNDGAIRMLDKQYGLEFIDLLVDQSEDADLSEAVNLHGKAIVAIDAPAFDGTTSAITLQTSPTEGGTYKDVYDEDGNQLSITVATSARFIALDPALYRAFYWLRLSLSENQTGDKTIRLWVRPIG